MREWIRGLLTRTKKFDMFRSVWFANLDLMVDNIRYLQDDGDELEQSNVTNKSDQSNESKQCSEPSHNCAHHSTRTCNCAGHDCIDNDNGNTSYFGSDSAKHFNDSVNEYNELYTKLKYYDDVGYRESTRSTQG